MADDSLIHIRNLTTLNRKQHNGNSRIHGLIAHWLLYYDHWCDSIPLD